MIRARRIAAAQLSLVAALSAYLLQAGPARANLPAAPDLAPQTEEGDLWAAECVATFGSDRRCTERALSAGKPGGILQAGRFVLLLLDGRILAQSCSGPPPARVRASGVLHQGSRAMTVFSLSALCEGNWQVVDLPFSGIQGNGTESGNE